MTDELKVLTEPWQFRVDLDPEQLKEVDRLLAPPPAPVLLERLRSLESEYNAYHFDNGYWRGVKYAIDRMKEGLW